MSHATSVAMNTVARIWSVVLQGGSTQMTCYKHVPHVFNEEELLRLTLPLDADGEQVALVEGIDFQRFQRDEMTVGAVQAAYTNHHRTRVREGIEVQSDGWFSLAALQLARLSRCGVVCTVYESNAGDGTLIPHFDQWFGVIIQKTGSKLWTLWEENEQTTQLTTNAGDILLLPSNVKHHVATPVYSVHMVFAFLTHEPIAALA